MIFVLACLILNRMRLLTKITLAVFMLTPMWAQVRYFPQFANGSGLQTSVIFVNTGDDDAQVVVEFFDVEGQPVQSTLVTSGGDQLTGTTLNIDLPSGNSFSAQTTGQGDLTVGYIRFQAPDDVGGTAVFSVTDLASGVVLTEAGVPATSSLDRFSIFVDSLENQDTGLAIVADGDSGDDATFSLTIFDSDFQQIATTVVPLQGGQRVSRFVNEFFQGDDAAVAQAQEMQGSASIISDGAPLAAITLRQLQARPFPEEVQTLTTFPVVPGTAEDDDSGTTGSFAVRGGRVETRIDVSGAAKQAAGIYYRLFNGDAFVSEGLDSTPASGVVQRSWEIPQGASIDRVEIRVVYSGGEFGPIVALDR